MKKHLRELRREFPQALVEYTGKQHIRIVLPNGRSVFTSGTPSDVRIVRKVRARVRRAMRMNEGDD
jgi:hypothetical protein